MKEIVEEAYRGTTIKSNDRIVPLGPLESNPLPLLSLQFNIAWMSIF